jgi:hypothetical protein
MSLLPGARKSTYHKRPKSSGAPAELREPSFAASKVASHPKALGGGAGGIRTLDRALQPYNGLANRRLQPLGHSSIEADMPDAGASRKRQIPGCLIRSHLATRGLLMGGLNWIPEAGVTYLSRARHKCVPDASLRNFFHGDLRCRFGVQPRLQSEFAQ